jgi:hypothetical protein
MRTKNYDYYPDYGGGSSPSLIQNGDQKGQHLKQTENHNEFENADLIGLGKNIRRQ